MGRCPTTIHASAIIEPGAVIGDECHIGPYCHVGADVRLGRSNVLLSHVVVSGRTTLGTGNEIHPFAVIGSVPEDKKFRKEFVTYTRIGSGNVFREYCTVNAGQHAGAGYGDREQGAVSFLQSHRA